MDRMQRFRIAYFMVVWVVVVALIVQVSLIGLWLFPASRPWASTWNLATPSR
ncbi:MAG TPA: hypothetical protein VNO76_03740 [Thermoplasmata archaeon]|nr:hypothetical protein [Thermoplasmata archaeon]